MSNSKNSFKGFSAVEIVFVIFIVCLLGLVGWSVEAIVKKSNQSSNGQSSSAGLKTYSNQTYGFSIQIPQHFSSGYGGACTKQAGSYRPAKGVVPATVIQDNNNFYVTESYTYQLGGEDTSNDVTSFRNCQKIITTAPLIKQSISSSSANYSFEVIPIELFTVKNRAEITADARNIFGDQSITVTNLTRNNGGWQDVELTCKLDVSSECEDFGGKFYLRYYAAKSKLVFISLGQAGNLAKPDGSGFYDDQVVNSFKLN